MSYTIVEDEGTLQIRAIAADKAELLALIEKLQSRETFFDKPKEEPK